MAGKDTYSALRPVVKQVVAALTFYGSFSANLTAPIYWVLLLQLANNYRVSVATINLSNTVYLVFQAIAPITFYKLFAPLSFRTALAILQVIIIGSNIALALQNSLAALMILRAAQSIAGSTSTVLRYGIIASIFTPAERAFYISIVDSGLLLALTIGPLFGGLLSQRFGWRSIFWFLLILNGVYGILCASFLPETNRRIVGNGSATPNRWWLKSAWGSFAVSSSKLSYSESEQIVLQDSHQRLSDRKVPSSVSQTPARKPFKLRRTLQLYREPYVVILVLTYGILYADTISNLTLFPDLLFSTYGLGDVQSSLCYIPGGVGTILGSIANGKLLNYRYRQFSEKMTPENDGKPRSKNSLNADPDFALESARLSFAPYNLLLGTTTFIGRGWCFCYATPLAVPLVLSFVSAFFISAALNSVNTLLIDRHPDDTLAVTSFNSLNRGALAAVAAAVVAPLYSAVNAGWCFTIFGLLGLCCAPLLWLLIWKGRQWRLKDCEEAKRVGDPVGISSNHATGDTLTTWPVDALSQSRMASANIQRTTETPPSLNLSLVITAEGQMVADWARSTREDVRNVSPTSIIASNAPHNPRNFL